MPRRRRAAALPVVLSVLAPWLAPAAAAAPVQSAGAAVREELLVREVEVLLEAPQEAAIARRALAGDGLLLEEDGVVRAVANVARLSPSERWQVVVMLDQVLAAPELVAAGAMVAAAAAADLTALGTVEVVTADPAPRVLLSANADSEAVAAALAETGAAALRNLRSQPAAPAAPAAQLSPERAATARRQCDRWLAWLANRGSGVPRLLVLVTDGVTLSPAGQNYAGGRGTAETAAPQEGLDAAAPRTEQSATRQNRAGQPGPAERIWVEAIADTARSLGALGWTVAVLAPRAEALRLSALPERDSDRYQRERLEELRQGAPTEAVNLLSLSQLRGRRGSSPGLAVGDAVDLRRQGLRPFASETGGALLGRDGELAILLERLRRRWLLAYQSPSPRDGRQHRVRVRTVADGRELAGQRWTGSALESVTGARLRLLLAGEMPVADAELAVDARRDHTGDVMVELAAPAAVAPGDLRLAAAFVTAAGEVRVAIHERNAEAATGDWRPWRLPVPPTAAKLAVVLENVRLGTWAGALTPIAEGEGSGRERRRGGDETARGRRHHLRDPLGPW